MKRRRRAGPAAIAAALIGAGLALYRPRLVPELRPGSRGAPPAAAGALAAAIDWPRTPPGAPPGRGDGGERARGEEPRPEDPWRDALADRPFAAWGAGAAPGASAAAPRRALAPRAARTAGTDATRAPGNPPRAAGVRESRSSSPPVRPRSHDPAPAKNDIRRAPLAVGPAASDEETDGGEDGNAESASRGAVRPGAGAWTRRARRPFPLFRPPRRAAGPARAAARRRVRPLLLSKRLGRGALRPPPASIVPPDLSALNGRKPLRLPDGSPVPSRPYELDRIEAHDPRRPGGSCRRRASHWDAGPRWHDGAARGVIADARWLWLWREETRWWAAPEPESSPLLRHRGLWWGKQRGVWFALHDGELWSWRRFSEWDAEGLIRLADGVELVYSADFTMVAVITPGEGAVLYDAATGAELGHWLESELPRRRPRPPAVLRLPRGI